MSPCTAGAEEASMGVRCCCCCCCCCFCCGCSCCCKRQSYVATASFQQVQVSNQTTARDRAWDKGTRQLGERALCCPMTYCSHRLLCAPIRRRRVGERLIIGTRLRSSSSPVHCHSFKPVNATGPAHPWSLVVCTTRPATAQQT